MAIFIYDDDAAEKMAVLEGFAWLEEQRTKLNSPFHLGLWKKAWSLKCRAGMQNTDKPLNEFIQRPSEMTSPIIYGNGGFHRYVVEHNGEIQFSQMHATAKKIEFAKNLGFTLT